MSKNASLINTSQIGENNQKQDSSSNCFKQHYQIKKSDSKKKNENDLIWINSEDLLKEQKQYEQFLEMSPE